MEASGTFTYITDVPEILESLDLTTDGILDLGHTWLLDGYIAHDIHTTEWIVEDRKLPVLLYDHGISYVRYYHFNWGNCGIGNGYFLANVYDDSKAAIPDKSNDRGSTYNFKYVKFMPLYNTRPAGKSDLIGGTIIAPDSLKRN